MPSTTGIRRRLPPALLAGAPYRIGDRMAERYRVKDAIGLGPLGYVFRAEDEQQGIDVAVKMIHPRFVQTAEERTAFAQAVEPAKKFIQPSLARLHEMGVDQGWPYLTYSFLDGLTLRRMIDSRLAKGHTFTLEEVEPFLGQLAAALEAAHPLGAHGDLKPENVVILPDMLRVTDWGVARGLPRLPFVQALRQKLRPPLPRAGGGLGRRGRSPRRPLRPGRAGGRDADRPHPGGRHPRAAADRSRPPGGGGGLLPPSAQRAARGALPQRARAVRDLRRAASSRRAGVGREVACRCSRPSPAHVAPVSAADLPRLDGAAAEPGRGPRPRGDGARARRLDRACRRGPAPAAGPRPSRRGQCRGARRRWRSLQAWDQEEGSRSRGDLPSETLRCARRHAHRSMPAWPRGRPGRGGSAPRTPSWRPRSTTRSMPAPWMGRPSSTEPLPTTRRRAAARRRPRASTWWSTATSRWPTPAPTPRSWSPSPRPRWSPPRSPAASAARERRCPGRLRPPDAPAPSRSCPGPRPALGPFRRVDAPEIRPRAGGSGAAPPHEGGVAAQARVLRPDEEPPCRHCPGPSRPRRCSPRCPPPPAIPPLQASAARAPRRRCRHADSAGDAGRAGRPAASL